MNSPSSRCCSGSSSPSLRVTSTVTICPQGQKLIRLEYREDCPPACSHWLTRDRQRWSAKHLVPAYSRWSFLVDWITWDCDLVLCLHSPVIGKYLHVRLTTRSLTVSSLNSLTAACSGLSPSSMRPAGNSTHVASIGGRYLDGMSIIG